MAKIIMEHFNIKNKWINSIGWLGFIITLIIIIFMQKCGNTITNLQPSYKITVNKYYDSTAKEIKVPVPIPGDSIPYPVPTEVDTLAILKKYFTKYYFEQVVEDSNLRAVISDTVFQNAIVSRKFSYKWKQPVSIVTENKTILPPPRLSVGMDVMISKTTVDIMPGIIYNHKNWSFTAKYPVLSKGVVLGAYLHPKINRNGKRKLNISP